MAIDGGAAQIDVAPRGDNIDYRVALAKDLTLVPVSAALICVL
jgi:hypothetical protein